MNISDFNINIDPNEAMTAMLEATVQQYTDAFNRRLRQEADKSMFIGRPFTHWFDVDHVMREHNLETASELRERLEAK